MQILFYSYIYNLVLKIYYVASKNAIIAIKWTIKTENMSAKRKIREEKLTWN